MKLPETPPLVATIARFTLRQARQSRLLVLAGILLVLAFVLTGLAGAVALTEHAAIQAVLLAAGLRVGAVGLIALFAVSACLREQDDRTLDLVLALDAPRSHYVFGKLAAFALIAVALAIACALPLLIWSPPMAVAGWALSLACEAWLVATLGLLLAFTFRQPVTALAALVAFYLLARGLDALLLLARDPVFVHDGPFRAFIESGIALIAWVMPGLHRFTDAAWLGMGGFDPALLLPVLGQTAVYGALLAAAAAFDLYRREF
jgi:hypothetical protein